MVVESKRLPPYVRRPSFPRGAHCIQDHYFELQYFILEFDELESKVAVCAEFIRGKRSTDLMSRLPFLSIIAKGPSHSTRKIEIDHLRTNSLYNINKFLFATSVETSRSQAKWISGTGSEDGLLRPASTKDTACLSEGLGHLARRMESDR
jgi:hypothetical protein